MKILITGASGFIASQIVTDLLEVGHQVICCVRDPSYTQNIFPTASIIRCDFIKDNIPEIWLPRLHNIDVVINCVGILHHRNKKMIWAIHNDTPRALFGACVQAGVKKIIQISALGIDHNKGEFARSKKAADDYLLTLPIPAIVLRPSLVYGRGSYGGTSLFRGLAGLPWVIPVPNKGEQIFQPIYLPDLSRAVVHLVSNALADKTILHAAGPQQITLCEILTTIRSWLGFGSVRILSVPLWLINIGARFGNWIPGATLNSDAIKMLVENNTTTADQIKKFQDYIGFSPRSFTDGVYQQPSTVQDHWHARLYFLKPLLQLSIAFIWLFTAWCSAFLYPKAASYDLLAQVGVAPGWQPLLLYGASALNAFIGLAVLCRYQIKKIGLLQIAVILIYTTIITWKLPALWLEPFAPIAKNIPLLSAILVYLGLESQR